MADRLFRCADCGAYTRVSEARLFVTANEMRRHGLVPDHCRRCDKRPTPFNSRGSEGSFSVGFNLGLSRPWARR